MEPVIAIKNIQKRYGGVSVLDDISFSVNEGEVVALIGSSGSGKTTLLRCLNHLTPIDAGEIRVNGFTVTPQFPHHEARALREVVGIVFQQFNLWPHKTVLENLTEAPVLVKKEDWTVAVARAEKLLHQVGLLDKTDAYPEQLSGGQQQRVAIARALMMRPQVLLLDEVTSALDPELTAEVLNVIKQVTREYRQTTIMVTHELGFAKQVADRAVFIDNGKVVEEGPASTFFEHPKQKRTQQFLEKILHFDY